MTNIALVHHAVMLWRRSGPGRRKQASVHSEKRWAKFRGNYVPVKKNSTCGQVCTASGSELAPAISPFRKLRSLPLSVLNQRSSAQVEKFLSAKPRKLRSASLPTVFRSRGVSINSSFSYPENE